jgi:hypothetical protein
MESSYLESKTFGVGQLITQRKLFKVPEHQRNFSWESSNVRQFFEDVTNAMDDKDPDYFIGLIVLMGPREGTWFILDGQQRLATVTMLYSAIRYWLANRNEYLTDANQIESEFIGVRQLGGKNYNPRLTLNVENQNTFLEMVVQRFPSEEIQKRLKETTKGSSNRLLIEAVDLCRRLVSDYLEKGSSRIDEQASRLFDLSAYLEERVKVVVLEVLSEANAFVIFEALNARGNELSALDLVKNYVFGSVGTDGIDQVRQEWALMTERIEEKNADDFLRVFWTSCFGRVQKHELFDRIKKSYPDQLGAARLSIELSSASERYSALDDPQHEIWTSYGSVCRKRIETLIVLGNRQVRIPIMSAIGRFDTEGMAHLLWLLMVLTIRYQVVGRRRTGILEIACARMANSISSGNLMYPRDIEREIGVILPSDEEFFHDFLRFSDKKASRVLYFLAQLEFTERYLFGGNTDDFDDLALHTSEVVVGFISPKGPMDDGRLPQVDDPDIVEEKLHRLGNRCLVEASLAKTQQENRTPGSLAELYACSRFLLTSMSRFQVERTRQNVIEFIDFRQNKLAELALKTWGLEEGSHKQI